MDLVLIFSQMNLDNKQKLMIVFYIIIFAGSTYMSGIYAIPSLAFSLFFYSMITYSIYSMYKKIRDRSFQIFDLVNYHEFLQAFLYKASTLMILMIVIIGGFAVYENEVDPATMPIYTISNGDKTVIFHAMSHIGTPKFYEQVKKNIELSKKDEYVLYFE